MGGKHDGVPGFQSNECFVAHGGGGVGAGDNGGDDPYAHAHLPEPGLLAQNPHGFHIPDGRGHIQGCKPVFHGLIGGVSEAGFPDSLLRQRLGLLGKPRGNRLHNGIQLLLGEAAQRPLGLLRLRRQNPRLLPGP